MVVTRRMKMQQDDKGTKKKRGVSSKGSNQNQKDAVVSNGKTKEVSGSNDANEGTCLSPFASGTDCRLVPLPLIATIFLCSGMLWMLSFRDAFTTGRPLFAADTSLLEFTKSTKWYDDSRGWKSTMGGMSAVQRGTSDENDMGGLFVRKVCGVASLAYHMHKLLPTLIQRNADWRMGHYNLLLGTGVFGNLCLMVFFLMYMGDMVAGGAGEMCVVTLVLLGVEALVMFLYVLSNVKSPRPAITEKKPLPEGKTPNSLVSNIAARTISLVSGMIAIISARDLLFPGTLMGFPPRDDIYLEWTGSLMHSPPEGSQEYETYGLTSPFRVGDKFCSRLMGLYLLLGCVQKFVAAFGVRVGRDGISGDVTTRMFWTVQAVGDGLLLFVIRVFASAAKSASLDLKWHAMSLGYETVVLGLYAFF